MLSGGALRLASLYAVAPGTRAVVATTSDRGLDAALALQAAGVQVVAVADLRATPGAAAARAAARRRRGPRGLDRARGRGPQGRAGGHARRAGRSQRQRAARAALRVRPAGHVGRRGAGDVAHRAGRRAHRLRRRRAATSPSPSCPTAWTRPARSPGPATTPSARAGDAGAHAAHALGLGEAPPPAPNGATAAPRARGGAARRGGRRARQVLRVPVRGRHREGHPPQRRGGLRLDRAVQALHDGHHGPLPGPHVPAARGAAHGPGDRAGPPEHRHHDRAPAVVGGSARRARRPSRSSPPSAPRSIRATARSAPR